MSARLIACERSGRWAIGLRRELVDAGVRVWEARTLADAWKMLDDAPASFLVAELTAVNARAILARMAWFSRDFPAARIAVVAQRRLAGYEGLVREAGAVYFTCSLRQLGPLAGIALRHLATVPPPQLSMTERIWAGLPWGKEEG